MSRRSTATAMAGGAMAAYFLDPDRGRARRAKLKDQAAAAARSAGHAISSRARYQRNVVAGWLHEARTAGRPPRVIDDATLVQKVKSEVLGNWAAQGHAAVEAHATDGNVTLVTPTADDADIRELSRRVGQVEGVAGVEIRRTAGDAAH